MQEGCSAPAEARERCASREAEATFESSSAMLPERESHSDAEPACGKCGVGREGGAVAGREMVRE